MVDFYSNNLGTATLYLILIVTRQCNFRCPYCYEEHANQIMKSKTYDSIITFILKQLQIKKCNGVHISFFGGEPLLEFDSIISFSKKVKSVLPNGCKYSASMTTNGYELSSYKFESLINQGVSHFQITVDGVREDHNKTRILSNGNGSWDTIIENLILAKKTSYDFSIVIRTNFTPTSLCRADDFYDFISTNFGDDPRFSIHFECARDLGGERVHNLDLYENQGDIIDTLSIIARKHRLVDSTMLGMITNFLGCACYAGKNTSFVIDYDGTIRKCSVCIDNAENEVGKIFDDGSYQIDAIKMSNWTSYRVKENCLECEIYPLCQGKKCPSNYYQENFCNELKQIYCAHLLQNYS